MSIADTTIREGDHAIHPAALARAAALVAEEEAAIEAAIEDARNKRLRFWTGLLGVALCGAAFIAGMIRDQPAVMVGAFLGGMVAGNRIPFMHVVGLFPTWRGKLS